jgi:hypothetical protein
MTRETINFKNLWQTWNWVLVLAIVKLLIHLLANTNYGFHRDEFLYLIEGEHLAWGYMEVPPVIAVLSKMALGLGGSLFVVRLFPTLIGSITVFLIGVMVKDLGGKKWAQILACLAFILSPAFLRSNMLFQPVSFDQFCWFLSAFFIVRLIRYQQPKYWYYLGMVAGLGFLTKYSIVFFYAAFLIAIFLTPLRHWLRTPYPYFAIGIALAIALPNLLWQYEHNLPVIKHFTELSQTQLKNVQTLGFLKAQLRFHHAALIIWLPGLLYLFFSSRLSAYRILAWIYLFVILILVLLSGKSYYSMGAYPMLMAAGGVAMENFLELKPVRMKYALVLLLFGVTFPFLPYGIPVVPIEKMQQYCSFMKDKFQYEGPLRWEDGKIHPLPQDYADMHGWEEMAAKVGRLYHSLSPAEQKTCLVYGGSYSHASSINYYRRKYQLPEVYSFVGSFLVWAPDSVDFDRQIMIDDVLQTHSQWFESMQLVDSIQNPYAREKGYIYYRSNPKVDVKREWTKVVTERKRAYDF